MDRCRMFWSKRLPAKWADTDPGPYIRRNQAQPSGLITYEAYGKGRRIGSQGYRSAFSPRFPTRLAWTNARMPARTTGGRSDQLLMTRARSGSGPGASSVWCAFGARPPGDAHKFFLAR